MRPRFHNISPGATPAGTYAVQVAGGVVCLVTIPVPRALVPLTMSINGVCDFVWDANDELVLTEVNL